MKITALAKQEIEVKSILINISPRYIGDGDDDDMPTDFPLLNEDKTAWIATVDVETGVIEGWPIGDTRNMHVKVCDSGCYTLLGAHGEKRAWIEDAYVPNGVVPGSYGDYVELNINEDGRITNWPQRPDFSAFFDFDC